MPIPDEQGLFKQLEIIFGAKKAKKLIKQIKEIKEKNPGVYYNFIFNEDGTITPIEKSENENN